MKGQRPKDRPFYRFGTEPYPDFKDPRYILVVPKDIKPCVLEGYDKYNLIVFRGVGFGWQVLEGQSGLSIGRGSKTQIQARQVAKEKLDSLEPGHFDKAIEEHTILHGLSPRYHETD